jgi:predicted CoA-binding protein
MAVGDRTDFGGTPHDRLRILSQAKTIAMVGLSSDQYRPSQFAGIYLRANGYKIIPVNPRMAGHRILGQMTYAQVRDIKEPVDIVDVFRSEGVEEIARQAVEIKAKVLWMQLTIVDHEAARIAREGGLEVVMDRCCKIEHGRFFGGLSTIGLNTGLVFSRRRIEPDTLPAPTDLNRVPEAART